MPWVSSDQAGMMLHDAEETYSKAAKAEHNFDLDQAFKLYVKAAEDFLHLGQMVGDARIRATCKSQAGKALERAEKIKLRKPDLKPVAKNYFSENEQLYVLRKSSFVNDMRVPLWEEVPSPQQVRGQPQLSPEQQSNSAVWQRHENTAVFLPSLPLLPEDILQHIITDCSVCASVAVCAAHHRRFRSEIGLASIVPEQPVEGTRQSQIGVYHLRFLFNGAYRRITINDYLPTYPNGTLMCMSTGPKKQIWPSLIEKAYMKLMGSYDFPGSNSCTDLHSFIGWIPDHINLKSSQPERLWARILNGFTRGLCLLTIGTGDKVLDHSALPTSLLPTHCYAVVDVMEEHGNRRLRILDSWVPSSLDDVPADALVVDTERQDRERTFELPWQLVCNIFEGLYVSWDPGIFKNRIHFHGTWKSSYVQEDGSHAAHFRLRLQVAVDQSLKEGQALWVQLTRHVSNTARTSEYISVLVDSEDQPNHQPLDVNPTTLRGEYINSPHTLARTKVTPSDTVLHLITSYEGHYTDVGFTITVYSNATISWAMDLPKALRSKEVEGAFTPKTAGGNPTYPTFMDNPQYHLRILPDQDKGRGSVRGLVKAPTSIVLRGPRNIPLNISVVWSQGQRITEMGENDIAGTSGPYGYGFAQMSQDLSVGDYTLIVSAFEPQVQGQYKLRVESPLLCELVPIPQEGAGMYSRIIRGNWSGETAAGGPSRDKFTKNPAYEIEIDSTTHIIIRLQLTDWIPSTPTNISISQLSPTGRTIVATSGPYTDSVAGAVTPKVILAPGKYLAIPSTYNPGVERGFKLMFYTTTPVRITSMQ